MASPKSELWWVLWVRVCPWLVLAPKVFQLCINQLVIWFMHVCVSDWLLVILPSLISKLQHAPLPPKCYEPGNMPQLLILSMSSFHTHIWIYQGAWERIMGTPPNMCLQKGCHHVLTMTLSKPQITLRWCLGRKLFPRPHQNYCRILITPQNPTPRQARKELLA